jgi:hypothetical protein
LAGGFCCGFFFAGFDIAHFRFTGFAGGVAFACERADAIGPRSFFGVLGSRRSLPAWLASFFDVVISPSKVEPLDSLLVWAHRQVIFAIIPAKKAAELGPAASWHRPITSTRRPASGQASAEVLCRKGIPRRAGGPIPTRSWRPRLSPEERPAIWIPWRRCQGLTCMAIAGFFGIERGSHLVDENLLLAKRE